MDDVDVERSRLMECLRRIAGARCWDASVLLPAMECQRRRVGFTYKRLKKQDNVAAAEVNRQAWIEAFNEIKSEGNLVFRQGDMIAAYVNFSRSSCLTERLLKENKGAKRARPRLPIESRKDVVHLRRSGPRSCDELVHRIADPDTGKVTLVPNPILDDAVEIWRGAKGARHKVQRRQ